jgi:hypothetical protein
VNRLFFRFDVTTIPVLVVLDPSFNWALDKKDITDIAKIGPSPPELSLVGINHPPV